MYPEASTNTMEREMWVVAPNPFLRGTCRNGRIGQCGEKSVVFVMAFAELWGKMVNRGVQWWKSLGLGYPCVGKKEVRQCPRTLERRRSPMPFRHSPVRWRQTCRHCFWVPILQRSMPRAVWRCPRSSAASWGRAWSWHVARNDASTCCRNRNSDESRHGSSAHPWGTRPHATICAYSFPVRSTKLLTSRGACLCPRCFATTRTWAATSW